MPAAIGACSSLSIPAALSSANSSDPGLPATRMSGSGLKRIHECAFGIGHRLLHPLQFGHRGNVKTADAAAGCAIRSGELALTAYTG